MVIVGRALVASGLGVYGAIHVAQALGGPDSSPGWLTIAFFLAGTFAIVLAGAVFVLARWRMVTLVAAVLASASFVALLASLTTGFLGVTEENLTSTTMLALVAEVMVLLGAAVALFGERFHFDEESSIRQAALDNRPAVKSVPTA